MRIFNISIFIIAVLLTLSIVSAYPQDKLYEYNHQLIPGSDKPEIKTCKDVITAFIYDDFVVYVQSAVNYEGTNIYIYNKKTQLNDPCKVDFKRADFKILVGEFGGANNFIGAYGNTIFLDQWTGEDFKRLLGIDVTTQSLVFLDTYAKPKIKKGELLYYKTLKARRKSVRDKIPCPEAEDWIADGMQVLYVEKMRADLSTVKKQASGEYSCIPTEPIGSLKPRSYGH